MNARDSIDIATAALRWHTARDDLQATDVLDVTDTGAMRPPQATTAPLMGRGRSILAIPGRWETPLFLTRRKPRALFPDFDHA